MIRLRLLGVPLERDEGEYAYMAQQILHGILPYTESLSMKFPGIFFVYAGILTIFGQTSVAIHLALLFVNLATVFLIIFLGRGLLGLSAGIAAGVSFSILTLSPDLHGFWSNSEHFVLFPAVAGVLLLRTANDQAIRFFLSGLLLGGALLIKQHAIFFFIFGMIYLGFRIVIQPQSFKKPLNSFGIFAIGGVVPIALSALLYGLTGNFSDFWFSTVQYALEYVSLTSPGEGFENFKYNFAPILESNFLILELSLIGLVSLLWKMDSKEECLFFLGFFLCSFLAITPGLYFRPHYFLLWMPSVALLAGAGFHSLLVFFKHKALIFAAILTLALGFPLWIQKDTFFSMPVFEVTRSTYGLNPFPESNEIAKYIANHSKEDDKVAVLGSEPQIYFYSQRKSATRHLYMYPLTEKHVYAGQMQDELIREITEARPVFIVVVNAPLSWVPVRPDFPSLLKNWAKDYLSNKYEVSGVIDILSNTETVYNWGDQAKTYSPRSRYHLLVYKRRK